MDLTFLKRVLVKIGTKAVQAMLKGRNNCLIREYVHRSIIADTCVDIPDEIKPKLFHPLMTTKARGQGFGLVVIKHLVQTMGGTINFERQGGIGQKIQNNFS